MKHSPARLSLVAAVTLAASTLSASPIVVGALKGPSGIGMVKLLEGLGPAPDGSAFKVVPVASADLMTAKLISGEYDAGVLPVNVAAKLYSSGVGIELASIVGNGMVSFLSSDASIRSLADLKGKRVFVAGQGATPDFLFRSLLKGAGLEAGKDLSLDYSLPYPEAAAALAAGKIDYALLPEPFATMARLVSPALLSTLDIGALWTRQTGQADYPMTAFVISKKLANGSPKAVEYFLEAYEASIAWVESDPAQAGALVEKEDLGLKAGIASAAIPRSAYVFERSKAARPSVEALLRIFLELSPASVGGSLPDDGFYASFE